MNRAGSQGVLAVRQGEYRQYYPISDHPEAPAGAFAVCLIKTPPLPPQPHRADAEGTTIVGAFLGAAGTWDWLHIEEDTKQMICEDMVDECKVGEWYWLEFTTKTN